MFFCVVYWRGRRQTTWVRGCRWREMWNCCVVVPPARVSLAWIALTLATTPCSRQARLLLTLLHVQRKCIFCCNCSMFEASASFVVTHLCSRQVHLLLRLFHVQDKCTFCCNYSVFKASASFVMTISCSQQVHLLSPLLRVQGKLVRLKSWLLCVWGKWKFTDCVLS